MSGTETVSNTALYNVAVIKTPTGDVQLVALASPSSGGSSAATVGAFTAISCTINTNKLVLAASANTKFVTLFNPIANSANINIAIGFTATLANYTVVLVPGAYYEVPLSLVNLIINAFSIGATQTLNLAVGT